VARPGTWCAASTRTRRTRGVAGQLEQLGEDAFAAAVTAPRLAPANGWRQAAACATAPDPDRFVSHSTPCRDAALLAVEFCAAPTVSSTRDQLGVSGR